MPIPKAKEVKLSDAEQQGLEKLTKRHQVGQQIALRARIILAAADGQKNKEIVEKYHVTADAQFDFGVTAGLNYKASRWTI
jgi:hypothetical protein